MSQHNVLHISLMSCELIAIEIVQIALILVEKQYQDNSKDPQGADETATEHTAAATSEEIWPQKEGNRKDDGKAEAFCFTQSLQNWTRGAAGAVWIW
jgi:hypothetical protein